MKQVKHVKRKTLNPSENIVIVVKAKHIIRAVRFVMGLWGRRKRRKENEEIERSRLEHIEEQHRLSKIKWGAK